jgi:putative two-component system response regulator
VADAEAVVDLALEHQPALILLDLMMPRLDGHTVATRLRANPRTAAIPVVFLTAETAISCRSVSLMLGGLAHLKKPVTLDALRAVVEETWSP